MPQAMPDYTQRDATDRWNAVAEAWAIRYGANDANRRFLLDPVLLNLLGAVTRKRVLDAGCGEGYFARRLAQMGAQVTGMELAERMLQRAVQQEERQPLGIAYLHGDITAMGLCSESFQAIVSNVVLVDVQDLAGALQEFFRVLQPGGVLVCSTIHPCFFTRDSGWVKDEQGRALHFRIDRYFERGAVEDVPWVDRSTPMIAFHHTLEDLVDGLLNCGFVLQRLLEPLPQPEYYQARPNDFNYDRIPNFLVIKAQKP
ncbi:MAG: class I SAM-dependent methyltransferase [Chloroflexi bacterium]|nr:class I SAM-dependent methyltransferase [Chloroflexota bacterium]